MNGRYSFAFSSQPVAQTSSKRSASRSRRAADVLRDAVGDPVDPVERAGHVVAVGREAEQADHAVDVDEEDRLVCLVSSLRVWRNVLRGYGIVCPDHGLRLRREARTPIARIARQGCRALKSLYSHHMTLELGILLALFCAFATNFGFLLKHRGACAAPEVDCPPPAPERRRAVPLQVVRHRHAGRRSAPGSSTWPPSRWPRCRSSRRSSPAAWSSSPSWPSAGSAASAAPASGWASASPRSGWCCWP